MRERLSLAVLNKVWTRAEFQLQGVGDPTARASNSGQTWLGLYTGRDPLKAGPEVLQAVTTVLDRGVATVDAIDDSPGDWRVDVRTRIDTQPADGTGGAVSSSHDRLRTLLKVEPMGDSTIQQKVAAYGTLNVEEFLVKLEADVRQLLGQGCCFTIWHERRRNVSGDGQVRVEDVRPKYWIHRQSENLSTSPTSRLTSKVREQVVDAMVRRGVTRSQLAQLLNTTKSNVTQILSGNRNMTLKTLAELSEALDQRVDIVVTDVVRRDTK